MNTIKHLENYRLEHKITQAQLAKKLGVSFATVNRWFNGRTRPSEIQQFHIQKFLKGTKGK